MKFDFFEVFVRAAKITWKYKVLWIFGIFAGCSRNSSGGNSNSNSSYNGNPSQSPFSPEMERQVGEFVEKASSWFIENTWVVYVFIAFVLISITLQVIFGNIGTAGLIRGVVNVENGAETLSFGPLFSESLRYFWRLFGAGIILWLPVFVIFFGVFLIFILSAVRGTDADAFFASSLVLFIISFCCCLFPIIIGLGLYNSMINRAIVAEDMGLLEAFKRGWQVIVKNILPILGFAFVLFIINFIIGIIVMIPILIPTVIIMQSFMTNGFTSWQPFINLIIFSLCYTPVYWFINGVLTTYIETVWTLSYLGFTRPEKSELIFSESIPTQLPDSPPA